MTAAETKKEMQIGDLLSDKTIYAGELNGKRIYAAPKDAKQADGVTNLYMTFNEAAAYAKKLNQENYLGYNDWRIPTRKELDVLHENMNKGALKTSFNLAGSVTDNSCYYWSSTPYYDCVTHDEQFSVGIRTNGYRDDRDAFYSFVRCVR